MADRMSIAFAIIANTDTFDGPGGGAGAPIGTGVIGVVGSSGTTYWNGHPTEKGYSERDE